MAAADGSMSAICTAFSACATARMPPEILLDCFDSGMGRLKGTIVVIHDAAALRDGAKLLHFAFPYFVFPYFDFRYFVFQVESFHAFTLYLPSSSFNGARPKSMLAPPPPLFTPGPYAPRITVILISAA